ncbi:argininosuccinate lyase [Chloroflexus aggregans]|uniref:Argininosuccinate lyase n=1 Tax=Chloroflexus aggregans (strain MD-66 / DSM 9485) TaxID=326427 RepID=ARLY_CHLAD|nr:argininosuccinate lyase [Chloroflexus aggregans]B8GD12.1 RecName: Full=Argininosuccinate lyase; Short=ASAL; AltName: Full=Arginosuccinase [Chloroflexus aggregans DSM 9485]ACL23212.1 argininosuccinate lyase [Chloroflexus aggregans DSM 9485]
MEHRLWGGRFSEPTAAEMRRFNDSFRFDRRLADVDITGSIAWAGALAQAGLIDEDEYAALVRGLELVRAEFANGTFVPAEGDEDIHTAVERRLRELIGDAALKLHTGRSRNDQVATDMRLYTIGIARQLDRRLRDLQLALLTQAELHTDTLMPGYTHLQRAQPITFGHWCLAYIEMFARDRSRLRDAITRMRVLPLGAGALAGNALGIERERLTELLDEFDELAANSLDAVSDRDFVAEILFICALIGIHLSRLAEDIILYASAEFGFIELADAYSTGSSLMPQKKNPDSMELLRGKSGRLLGNVVTLLTVLKGLPLTYNKDMQEDKEPLFDSFDTLDLGLQVAAAALATMTVHPERMAAALDDAMLATDLADELVRRGIPFRVAHGKVGQLVRRAQTLGVSLRHLPLTEYQAVEPSLDAGVYAIFDMARSVAQKASYGGTAPQRVREQCRRWRTILVESEA